MNLLERYFLRRRPRHLTVEEGVVLFSVPSTTATHVAKTTSTTLSRATSVNTTRTMTVQACCSRKRRNGQTVATVVIGFTLSSQIEPLWFRLNATRGAGPTRLVRASGDVYPQMEIRLYRGKQPAIATGLHLVTPWLKPIEISECLRIIKYRANALLAIAGRSSGRIVFPSALHSGRSFHHEKNTWAGHT